jgi:hypothetical protein
MAKRDTLWTCIGITKHVGSNDVEVVKVRCGVDLTRRIKSSQSKSYVKSKGEKLTEVRTDFINLPTPMLRLDALQFALSAPEFQSSEDQALIQEQIENRLPVTKQEKVIKPTKAALSLGKRKVSVEDVLDAVAE